MNETTKQIEARFLELGVKIETNDIDTKLDQLINKFKVPPEEARRNIVIYFLKKFNILRSEFFALRETAPIKASEIKEDGKWITMRGKVVQLWESNSDSISQAGLFGDESGTIKFTKWTKSALPDVEEGKNYLFKNVTTSLYQGQFSIKLNKTSQIIPIKENIEVGTTLTEFTGAIVDVQNGSGLIKRCLECKRALVKGVCGEHGKVEGQYDLRIKAFLDDGEKVHEILLNREIIEKFTGLTIEKAKEMATEALDQGVVLDVLKNKLVGRYYVVAGKKLDRFILVESIKLEAKLIQENVSIINASTSMPVAAEA